MKNNTTKLLAILLASLMALTACGGNKDSETTDNNKETIAETAAPETAAPETDAPETAAPETDGPSLTAGVVENNIYTNECLGFSINLEGWDYNTSVELEEFSQSIVDMVAKTEAYGDYMAANPTSLITDLLAYYDNGLTSINIQFHNQDAALNSMDDETILDLVYATQKDAIVSGMEETGITVTSFEKVTITFLGSEIPALKTVASVEGIPCYVLQIQKFNLGGFYANITFSSTVEDFTDLLASLCYPIGGTAPDVTIPFITYYPVETTEPTEIPEDAVHVGTLDGNVYTNPFAGISVTFGDTWSVLTADMIDGTNAFVTDNMLTNVPAGVTIQFFQAESMGTLQTFNLGTQKHDDLTKASFSVLTDDLLIDTMLLQKDELIQSYAAVGMDVTFMDKVTVTFLGEEHAALKTVGSISGLETYMIQIIDVVSEDYSVYYTIASYMEDTTGDILAMFAPLN